MNTSNSEEPSPHPKPKGGYLNLGKLQYKGTESGVNKKCHPCSLPLTIGNSRMEESLTPLEKAGSGAFAMLQGEADYIQSELLNLEHQLRLLVLTMLTFPRTLMHLYHVLQTLHLFLLFLIN